MAKLFALIAVLCFIQISAARVTRETPATLPTLSDLTKQAEDALTNIHTKFLEFVGVRSNDELAQVVQERSRSYADQLQTLLQQAGEQAKVHAGKADENFATLRNSLDQTIEELRSKSPELTSDVQRLEAKFQQSLRNVLHTTEHLGNRLKAEGDQLLPDVENVFKQIVSNTKEAATKVFDGLQKPAEQ